jgi:glyoxylase-like metal-dependent hydrolase (beta-lactamase superfamily II)
MHRRDALRAIVGGGLALTGWAVARAQQPKEAPRPGAGFESAPIKLSELAPGVQMLAGPGGNIAVLSGPDGVALIDSGIPARIAAIREAVATISPKPVRTLLNTHWHFDHTGGNESLGRSGTVIIAHENVRKRMATEQTVAFMNMKFPPSPASALPAVTFPATATLYLAGQTIEAFRVPPAHTDGDTVFVLKEADVVHAGDLFFNGNYPFIDASSGGNLDGMIAAADRLLAVVGPRTKVIPGHGPLATSGDLKVYRVMLAGVREQVAPLIASGKTVDEAVAAKPTRSFDEKWGKGFLTGDLFVRVIYSAVAAKK